MVYADSPPPFLPARRGPLLAFGGASLAVFAMLAVLVAMQWQFLIRADLAFARLLYDVVYPRPGLAHGIDLWTEAFGTWSMRILSVVVAGWLVLRRQFSAAAWALVTAFCANLAGLVGKLGVDRPRPDFVDPIAEGVGPSFPSGHALMSAVGIAILLYATLPLLRGAWRYLAGVIAVMIVLSTAGSRPMLGVHWVTDVVAGVALGATVVCFTLALWSFLPDSLRRWDRRPYVPRHGSAPEDAGSLTGSAPINRG